jgi:hypothetical protein
VRQEEHVVSRVDHVVEEQVAWERHADLVETFDRLGLPFVVVEVVPVDPKSMTLGGVRVSLLMTS